MVSLCTTVHLRYRRSWADNHPKLNGTRTGTIVMCRAWVFEAWPLGGSSVGGSLVYLRTVGADPHVVRGGITFSFGHGDVRLTTTNASFHSSHLVSVVAPFAPPSAGALPRTARIYFSCFQSMRQRDLISLGRHGATYAFWLHRPSRLPHCFDSAHCDRPPALFDEAAGIVMPHAWHGQQAMQPRVLPPGGRCEEWRALRRVQSLRECQRVAQLLSAPWQGHMLRRHGFAGCTLWRSSRGPAAVRFVELSGPPGLRGGACDISRDGGHCLCLGAGAANPLLSDCGRSLSALFGRKIDLFQDLRHASSALHDPCEAPNRVRPCLAKVLRQMPAPGMHELEDPSIITYRSDGFSASTRFTLDVVIALHSHPITNLLDALHGALHERVLATAWVYQKGQLPPAERRRLAGYARLRVRVRRLTNVGRCDHSYLTHITRNFETLATLTLFVKDTTFAHSHLGYGGKLLTFLRRLPAPVDFWGGRSLRRVGPEFEIETYVSDICRNRFVKAQRGRACYKSDGQYLRAQPRPLVAWRQRMGILNISTFKFVPGGIFAASAEAVRRTSRSMYERMLNDVGRGANVESGHYMERCWFAAFNGPQKHRPTVRLRSALAVYTIDLSPGAGVEAAVVPSPCNRTFAAETAGRSTIECLYFADDATRLTAAISLGWSAKHILTAADAHLLKRAPHLHRAFTHFDYSAYFHGGAKAGVTLNVPSVLEAMGGSYLTSSGASVALLASTRSKASGTSFSTAAILRRHTLSAAQVGEQWLNTTSVSMEWPDEAGDDRSLQLVLDRPQWTGRRTTVVLPRADDSDSDGPSSVLISSARLPVWWSWWTCKAKGHGSADTGRARISRCCKPADMESHVTQPRAQLGG